MSAHRYSEDHRRDATSGQSPVDVLLDRAAEMERWASMEEHLARNANLRSIDREAARAEAKRWRAKAAKLVELAIAEEAECAADPAAATGFAPGPPLAEQIGRALPRYLADKGGQVTSRRQVKRRRHR